MKTTEVTLQLPEGEAKFLQSYAHEHAITLGDLVARYARLLQRVPHPDNLPFTGAVPPDIDARETYREHLKRKHSSSELKFEPSTPRGGVPVLPSRREVVTLEKVQRLIDEEGV